MKLIALLALAATPSAQTHDGNEALESFCSKQPIRTGDTLPATCAVGERFVKMDRPSGGQLYLCVSAKNDWKPAPVEKTWYWYSPLQESQLRMMADNNGLTYDFKTVSVKGTKRAYTEITHTNKPSGYWPDYKLVTVK